ncbi:MAG: DUF3482 domain-containing protein [Gammaproteobacteria bacterium]|nr:MAG: DUF3482 domain-containing protein [Gammaproteobacteria bacterium]
MSIPVFAVVGRPNKGKSSIVATLARDDSVYIDVRAGSTTQARTFPMRVDGETLYELVDTPGIQRARAVLDWLNEHCDSVAARPETVRKFVAQHTEDPHFKDEYELLKPISEGAGIIYVVDGSCPFGADYEAEMEILRWSGRPSLALINPIENHDFIEEWAAGLGQFFQTVRVFDAHRAEITKQMDILTLFGHLDVHWRAPLERAVEVLRSERQLQHQSASVMIADLLVESLGYSVEKSIPEGFPEKSMQKILFTQYKQHLVACERQCRRQVEELFYYGDIAKSEGGLGLEESDLFKVEDWYLWGLSKRSMITVASSVGGIAGGSVGLAVDAGSAGFLGGLGTLVSGAGGALAGGVGAWRYADKIGRIKVKGMPTGGKLITYGPSRNINFPFVLLGRALLHLFSICKRTHASRSEMDLNQPLLQDLTDKERRQLGKIFDDIRNQKKPAERRAQLTTMIRGWCDSIDAR